MECCVHTMYFYFHFINSNGHGDVAFSFVNHLTYVGRAFNCVHNFPYSDYLIILIKLY